MTAPHGSASAAACIAGHFQEGLLTAPIRLGRTSRSAISSHEPRDGSECATLASNMGHRAWVATTRRVPAASTWLVQILPLELEAELFRQGDLLWRRDHRRPRRLVCMSVTRHPTCEAVDRRMHDSWVVPWCFGRHDASRSRGVIAVSDGKNGRFRELRTTGIGRVR